MNTPDNNLPSSSRGSDVAQSPPIERVSLQVTRTGLIEINTDDSLAGIRPSLRAGELCRGFIRQENFLTMKAQAELALRQAQSAATYRVYNFTNYDAAWLYGQKDLRQLTTIPYWREFAEVFVNQPRELVKKIHIIMPLHPAGLSDGEFDQMRESIRTNLMVAGFPMDHLVDWTRCPNADLLKRHRTYVLPPDTEGLTPKMFGGCYQLMNGIPPPMCITHDVQGGGEHHLTEAGVDLLIALWKIADRDGTLLYLGFIRTPGFTPQQLNLTVESQQLLDFWTLFGNVDPVWLYEFCCLNQTAPLRRNYRGKYCTGGISFWTG